MHDQATNVEDLNKPTKYLWISTILVALGSSISAGSYNGRYVNCFLQECEWFDLPPIIFGVLSIIFLIMHLREQGKQRMFKTIWHIGLFATSVSLITYGLGIGPGEMCPKYNC